MNENELLHKKKRPQKIIVRCVLFLLCLVFFAIFAFGIKFAPTIISYYKFADQCVNDSTAATFHPQQTSFIYDDENNLIAKLRKNKDVSYLPYDFIPSSVIDAFIAVEDRNFETHHGVDLKGLARVLYQYVKTNGQVLHGASTITQQLSRNVFLSHEVSLERKGKEFFIALLLERKYSKKEIMEFYVNNIYFGNSYYGINAAAKGYFSKDVSELSLSQIAYLCAIPNNPSYYDPVNYPEHTLERRDKILKDMYDLGYIATSDYEQAISIEITLNRPHTTINNYETTYAINCAVQFLMQQNGFEMRYDFSSIEDYNLYQESYNDMYALMKDKLYTGGYRIYTSLNKKAQKNLQKSIDSTLDFEKNTDDNGTYLLQGAATCIDNSTGKVVAIVGGRTQDNIGNYTLNRAFQSYRQPGSTIKPLIVYAPILEHDYTPLTIVKDQKIKDGPSNSDHSYFGNITLKTAVEQSRNTVAWNLFQKLKPKKGLAYIKNMHFSKIMAEDENLASALGGLTYGCSTVEMASGYCTLANNGLFRAPSCIVSVLDNAGNELYEAPKEEKIYETLASQEMIDILKGVITNGTARSMNWTNAIPAAGKTGTTNNSTDGWFCGMTPYYTISVWVGYDTPKTLSSLYGSSYPASIWKNAMNKMIKKKKAKDFDDSYLELSNVAYHYPSELLAGQPDSAILSAGYTIGAYRKDMGYLNQINDYIKNLDQMKIATKDDVKIGTLAYENAKAALSSIYGTKIRSEAESNLASAYDRFKEKCKKVK